MAQILLTGSDFTAPDRHENFNYTISRLLELGALPMINENDTIATEEIKVGDNDTLSALVAVSVQANLLIILSDVDGLYSADPHKNPNAKLIEEVPCITQETLSLGGGAGSALGTGGMKTKLSAAQLCTNAGCEMVIACGENPEILYDVIDGKKGKFTRFLAKR